MKNLIIYLVFLFAVNAAQACSCVPAPFPLDKQVQPKWREFVFGQWKRRLTATPNIFSGVVVEVDAVPSKTYSDRQTVHLSQVAAITGHPPNDSKVFNAFSTCPAALNVGERYIFFAGVDMQIGLCSVQQFSESAVESLVRNISILRGKHVIP